MQKVTGGIPVSDRQDIGGGYYVSVTSGFYCVDICKFSFHVVRQRSRQCVEVWLFDFVNGPTWKRVWLTSTALIEPSPLLYHISSMMITWTNWALFSAVNATFSIRRCGDELIDVTTEHHNVVDNWTLWRSSRQ